MTHSAQLLDTFPHQPIPDRTALIACIEASASCAQACTACADACLSEDDVAMLADCISTNLVCADLCAATERLLSRRTTADARLIRAMATTCMLACRICAVMCERHATRHAHCQICAEACRESEQACLDLARSIEV